MIQRKRITGATRPFYKKQKTTCGYRGRLATSSYLPRAPLGEWKYLDTAINVAIDTAGTLTLLNGLVPGTAATQRIGMKVTLRSIECQVTIGGTAGTGVDQVHRWGLIMDKQANGVGPTALTDFLSTGTVWGLRNLANRKRFKLLLSKRRVINATGESGTKVDFKVYMKFRRPIIVEFNAGTAGTVADIVSGSIHLFTIGTAVAGATAGSLS